MDTNCFYNSCSGCRVCDVQVAGSLCLQNRTKLVDICFVRCNCAYHNSADRKLAMLEGSDKESGRIITL